MGRGGADRMIAESNLFTFASVLYWDPVPEFIDPVFAKTSTKRSLSLMSEKWKRAFWACFREIWVYKFGHWLVNGCRVDE